MPLRGPFSCWWTTVVGTDDLPSRILPDNSADFVVADAADSWFVGPAESAELADFPAGTQIRGLRIRPRCIGAVTRIAAHELANRNLGIDDLLGSAVARELGERIWAGPTAALPVLGELVPPRTRRLVRDLVRFPSVAASELAAPYALSERQLRRLVLDEAGLAPKTLQKVARMQQFLRAADRPGRPLADAARSAGYADQSHLTRDIRRLTGLPPARLLAERRARKSAA